MKGSPRLIHRHGYNDLPPSHCVFTNLANTFELNLHGDPPMVGPEFGFCLGKLTKN